MISRRSRFCPSIVAAAVVAAMLVGCSQAPFKALQKDVSLTAAPVVGLSDDGLETLAVQAESSFVLRPLDTSDPLPALKVAQLSFTEASVSDALRMVLKDTDISLSVQGARRGASDGHSPVTVYNLSGTLPEVVERMSRQAGFFYRYRDKVLTIEPERQYLVTLPPAVGEDTYTGITNNIIAYGAQAPHLDRIGRTLAFKANRLTIERIEQYLDYVRANRQLIVYDVMIYAVDLTDGFTAGINWGAISATSPGGTSARRPLLTTTPDTSGGITKFDNLGGTNPAGLSTTFLLSRANTGALVSMLSSFGNVRKVSQPRIAILSGGTGYFRQGRNTIYVAKVGNNYGTSINSVTVETAALTTGITLNMTGDVTDGAIHTRIALKVQDIIGFNSFTALGTQLRLPDTTDRELGTEIVTPVGQLALMGGILVHESDDSASGLPGGTDGSGVSIPLSAKKSSHHTELVFVISPRVYRFSHRKGVAMPSASPLPTMSGTPAVAAGV